MWRNASAHISAPSSASLHMISYCHMKLTNTKQEFHVYFSKQMLICQYGRSTFVPELSQSSPKLILLDAEESFMKNWYALSCSRNSLAVFGVIGSLSCSQPPITGPCFEPHPHNTFLQSTQSFLLWCLPLSILYNILYTFLVSVIHNVTCKGDYGRGVRFDDWIYFTLYIHNFWLQVKERYRWFTQRHKRSSYIKL